MFTCGEVSNGWLHQERSDPSPDVKICSGSLGEYKGKREGVMRLCEFIIIHNYVFIRKRRKRRKKKRRRRRRRR